MVQSAPFLSSLQDTASCSPPSFQPSTEEAKGSRGNWGSASRGSRERALVLEWRPEPWPMCELCAPGPLSQDTGQHPCKALLAIEKEHCPLLASCATAGPWSRTNPETHHLTAVIGIRSHSCSCTLYGSRQTYEGVQKVCRKVGHYGTAN